GLRLSFVDVAPDAVSSLALPDALPIFRERIRSFSLHPRIRRWTRKRHGIDPDPLTLPGRRIYILPTGLGVTYGFMLFAMFLGARSEEHTSELQSREKLVCPLLPEKKRR